MFTLFYCEDDKALYTRLTRPVELRTNREGFQHVLGQSILQNVFTNEVVIREDRDLGRKSFETISAAAAFLTSQKYLEEQTSIEDVFTLRRSSVKPYTYHVSFKRNGSTYFYENFNQLYKAQEASIRIRSTHNITVKQEYLGWNS